MCREISFWIFKDIWRTVIPEKRIICIFLYNYTIYGIYNENPIPFGSLSFLDNYEQSGKCCMIVSVCVRHTYNKLYQTANSRHQEGQSKDDNYHVSRTQSSLYKMDWERVSLLNTIDFFLHTKKLIPSSQKYSDDIIVYKADLEKYNHTSYY